MGEEGAKGRGDAGGGPEQVTCAGVGALAVEAAARSHTASLARTSERRARTSPHCPRLAPGGEAAVAKSSRILSSSRCSWGRHGPDPLAARRPRPVARQSPELGPSCGGRR